MRGLGLPNSISMPISDNYEVVIVSGVEEKPEDVAGDSGIYYLVDKASYYRYHLRQVIFKETHVA